MEFNHIEYKKPFYKIKAPLREHLRQYSRLAKLPIDYEDLLVHEDMIPIIDKHGEKTLWNGVLYPNSERERINESLLQVYQMLYGDGSAAEYLRIGSIDFCSYGNSKPFRIKVVNELNDNHDYFYVKRADASRIYGLELEHIFSPDKMGYLVDTQTVVEEHVVGIPCDEYLKKHEDKKVENRIRLAKEFVKFNERCFVRLLGDMRSYNFVVEINQDFDNVQYRLRPMDFDQQSYEGRRRMYLPQFYIGNLAFVELAQEVMSIESAKLYVSQEQAAMKKRFQAAKQRTKSLLRRMRGERLSTPANVAQLAQELSDFYGDTSFLQCRTMGDLLIKNLECRLGIQIFNQPPAMQARTNAKPTSI